MTDIDESASLEDEAVDDEDYAEQAWEEEAGWRGPGVRRWWGWAAFVLSLAGFGDSLYLTVEHFTGSSPICAANGVINCLKVTTSPQSEVFGIFPVSLLGLLFFTGMLAVNLPPLWRLGGEPGRWLSWARLGMVIVGIGMVVYLISAELFSIKAICLWCTGVHIVTFLLFVLVVATFPTMVSSVGAEPG